MEVKREKYVDKDIEKHLTGNVEDEMIMLIELEAKNIGFAIVGIGFIVDQGSPVLCFS